jgi:ABC-2 type transport system ATP-binding protein
MSNSSVKIPAIQLNNLTKIYKGKNNKSGSKALDGLSLTIEKGEFFALLGENGAGKTTTIGILTSIVNKTSGNVEIMGVDIDKNFPLAKSFLGVVPQEFNFGIFEKIIDIVVNQAGYYGIPSSIAKPKAIKLLTDLGLGDKIYNQANSLSGGMKRRLMIARSLIHDPKILLLDEPTAGVDVSLRVGMWEYLKRLNQEHGVTIILTTHYLEEVEAMCKRAAILHKGKLVMLDTVENLINKSEDKHLESLFLSIINQQ